MQTIGPLSESKSDESMEEAMHPWFHMHKNPKSNAAMVKGINYPEEGIDSPVDAVIRFTWKLCKQFSQSHEFSKRDAGVLAHLLEISLQKLCNLEIGSCVWKLRIPGGDIIRVELFQIFLRLHTFVTRQTGSASVNGNAGVAPAVAGRGRPSRSATHGLAG